MAPEGCVAWVAFNLGLLIILALRAPWRRWFGARAALSLWLLPLALAFATWVPHGGTELAIVRDVFSVRPPQMPLALELPVAPAAIGLWHLWVAGAFALALWVLWSNLVLARRWQKCPRSRDPRCPQLTIVRADFGPALVEFWRPLLVLPHDFERTFNARQQALVLAHESAHAAAGDLRVRAVALLLAIAQWWNPLGWWALLRLMEDQELVCDARVIEQFPDARLDYARALAIGVLHPSSRLLSCSMHSTHPLLRRIAMLKDHLPSPRRRRVGGALGLVLTLAFSAVAWAADPVAPTAIASDAEFRVALKVQIDDFATEALTLGDRAGQPMSTRIERADVSVGIDVTVKETTTPDQVLVQMQIKRDGQALGEPALALGIGNGGRIEIGERSADGKFHGVSLDVMVSRAMGTDQTAHVSARTESEIDVARAVPAARVDTALPSKRIGAFQAALDPIDVFREPQTEDGC